MRIALLSDLPPGDAGGLAGRLQAVLNHAPVDLATSFYDCSSVLAVVPWRLPSALAGLAGRLEADGIEAIHFATAGVSGVVARWLAARLRVPLVGSYQTTRAFHGPDARSGIAGELRRSYAARLYRPCRRVLVPSDMARLRMVAAGWPEARVTVWPAGVDPVRFAPSQRSAARRGAWQVSDERPAILYAGSLARGAGLNVLGSLHRLLVDHRVAHRFVICGAVPRRDTLARALPDAVFTGAVNHDAQLGEIMASCDLFVAPVDTDSAGESLLEAQASGLPALVADEGAARENLQESVTGYVCATGSARAFGCRTVELLVDRARRKAMGDAARAFALTRHWAASLSPLFDSYREALKEASAGESARNAPPSSRRIRRSMMRAS